MSSKGRKQKMAKSSINLELGFNYNSRRDSGSLLDDRSICSEKEELNLAANEQTILKYLNGGIIKQYTRKVTREQVKTWLRNHGFHFIHFNVMCVKYEGSHKEYLPLEFAINTFSFEKGLTDQFHCFLNPGEVPLGYAFEAKNRSQIHRIPVNDRDELNKLCKHSLKNVVDKVNDITGLPANSHCGKLICFTFPDQITEVFGSFQWLASCAANEGITLPELSVFSVVDLVFVLGTYLGDPELKNKMKTELEFAASHYEFENGIDCEYHENYVRSGCSLGQTRKMACVISELLAKLLGADPMVNYKYLPELEDAAVVKAYRFANESVTKTLKDKNSVRCPPPPPPPPPGYRPGSKISKIPPGFENIAMKDVLDKLTKLNM